MNGNWRMALLRALDGVGRPPLVSRRSPWHEAAPPCRCDHPAEWHRHYRDGEDCSRTGCGCRQYKRQKVG
jgi:hypothetical protein